MFARTVVLVSLLLLGGLTVWLWAEQCTGKRSTPAALTVAGPRGTFAGGCFLVYAAACFRAARNGVVSTTVGLHRRSHARSPRNEQVSAGGTGHAESVQVVYDPAKISYTELLDVFWPQYRPADAEWAIL